MHAVLIAALTHPNSAADLVLHALGTAAEGDPALFQSLETAFFGREETWALDNSIGLGVAIRCVDNLPAVPSPVEVIPGSLLGRYFEVLSAECTGWEAIAWPSMPAIGQTAAVLRAQRDAVVPLEASDAVIDRVSPALVVDVDTSEHGLLGNPCVASSVVTFLLTAGDGPQPRRISCPA